MFVLLNVIYLFVYCYAQNVTVDIKYGRVQGHVVTLGTGQHVVSYLGIPYGKAPVGNLRFRVSVVMVLQGNVQAVGVYIRLVHNERILHMILIDQYM